MHKLHLHLNAIMAYLQPLMPLANCHMVEFFTETHWESLIPANLRTTLDCMDLNEAVNKFWNIAEEKYKNNETHADCELSRWIDNAKANCVAVDNKYCISKEKLRDHIKSWGGDIKTEIKVKEFMNSKKSYEVQMMSPLVASLHGALGASCCVEAGGGRGHLPVALTLGYGLPSLTIDCDSKTVESAAERIKIIQKQWHAIAKTVENGQEKRLLETTNKNLHRFASSFVTEETDIASIVREKFPEVNHENIKYILTGLHTCGNLGPDSLRIFFRQHSAAAVFNVPCCYHLLTETVDAQLFDVFQKDYGLLSRYEVAPHIGTGVPYVGTFERYLWHSRYNLGRNARMLAAQSIDRVVHQRQLPPKSLLYRALLQVIVKRHLPDFPLADGKLKRISHKCQDFDQYFKMADATLNLKLYDVISRDYLKVVCQDMDSQWKKMVLFYLLRLCLAQVIESVILLDRLLYLLENGFQKVYLVKLFDPVLSPRCHSIVAVR